MCGGPRLLWVTLTTLQRPLGNRWTESLYRDAPATEAAVRQSKTSRGRQTWGPTDAPSSHSELDISASGLESAAEPSVTKSIFPKQPSSATVEENAFQAMEKQNYEN